MQKKINILLSILFIFLLFTASTANADDIHDAVKSGDLEKVKMLLKKNSELLNRLDKDGMTPLHRAIEAGKNDIAGFLIEQGADINMKDKDNDSPLHYAAIFGNLEIAKKLVTNGGTSINEGNIHQMTPLHFACEKGHLDIVTLLLDSGADIDARDGLGRNALMSACSGRSMAVIETLIQRGADINVKIMYNNKEYTTLTLAALYGFKDFVDYLIDKEVYLPESIWELTLQYAVQRDYLNLYEYVQEKGLNISADRDKYQDLVYMASAAGSIKIVESLIGCGFDLNKEDKNGWTPLHHAASTGKIEILEYFIGKGLNKNARSRRGESAYNVAEFIGLTDVTDFLKQIGVDTSEPQFPELTGPYMGQKPPGDKPEMFMPGVVSGPYRAHGTITFSPDGKEVYWADMVRTRTGSAVFGMEMVGNLWTYPKLSIMWKDPSFSPDGKRLFFISREPLKEGEEGGKENYWYMDRITSGWSEPKPLGDAVNSVKIHWQCSADNRGNLYFSEFEDNMYCSQYKDGEYQKAVNLTELFKNETLTGRCPFISPEGDYLLFSHKDRLHVSFKKKDGTWTDRIDLGDEINPEPENGSPKVTPDGKYLFFQSTAGGERPWGIYWVSSKIIDKLRKENLKDN
ncbi:MAG: ankyrin repeat domain-containing protein [Candidatus Zixiibacteriota bacterium]